MRAPRHALGTVCLLVCGSLLAAGCGGGSSSSPHMDREAEAGKSRPAPPKSAFPAAAGKTLREVIDRQGNEHAEVKVTPEAQVFYPGSNRYPFTIAEKVGSTGRAGGEVPDAEAALYYAKVPAVKPGAKSKSGNKGMVGKAQAQALDEPAIGPFPAKIESLATKPAFQGAATTEGPDVATVVYSTELSLPAAGEFRPAVLIKEKGAWAAKLLPSVKVDEFAKIPRPGEKAPSITTPQNKVNYAEVLGKEPILLLFTTPQFCQSRVCGPVVDVARQAQHEFGGKANFIHMDIYNDNDPSKGVRPQV
ncbi:MAG TPA: hypothetical protein VHE08_05565, partial [Solirubrobacterales bacterium]|nr:hypothetical protein [Solirubrobacterales bacterium]